MGKEKSGFFLDMLQSKNKIINILYPKKKFTNILYKTEVVHAKNDFWSRSWRERLQHFFYFFFLPCQSLCRHACTTPSFTCTWVKWGETSHCFSAFICQLAKEENQILILLTLFQIACFSWTHSAHSPSSLSSSLQSSILWSVSVSAYSSLLSLFPQQS